MFYPLFGLGANVALIFSGRAVKYFSQVRCPAALCEARLWGLPAASASAPAFADPARTPCRHAAEACAGADHGRPCALQAPSRCLQDCSAVGAACCSILAPACACTMWQAGFMRAIVPLLVSLGAVRGV